MNGLQPPTAAWLTEKLRQAEWHAQLMQQQDHWADAVAYLMGEACKPTTHPTLERVMADAERAMYEANDWQGAEQAKAFEHARPSDRDGIEEELRRELRGVPLPIAKPAPVDTAKPALPALGVTASGDHRFGLWHTIE